MLAALLTTLIVLAVAFAGCQTPSAVPGLSTLQCPDCPKLTVSGVIDGDTLVSPIGTVRLFGVDTPERGERCYQEATQRLSELAGDTVRVEAGPRAQDRFGRSLYYVFTESGASIDEILVREGLGRAWTRDGQYVYTLMGLEGEARRDGTGCLW